MNSNAFDLSAYPSLQKLVRAQIDIWPDHKDMLNKSIGVRNASVLATSERISDVILKLIDSHLGDLGEICEDYRFMCEQIVLPEEWYFRRHGKYRLSTFEEAERHYYSNSAFMKRYMNGVLLSHVFWLNHANVLDYYTSVFLAGNKLGYRHLEIGPGHGLLLYFAAQDMHCSQANGWDVSDTSARATHSALEAMGVSRKARVVRQNLFEASIVGSQFDSVVISEVLEHMESPHDALKSLYACLAPGGRIFVNVPINSPAPDHIYLLQNAEEALGLVKDAGFMIYDFRLFPMTGYSLEQCCKHKLTISCAVIGTKPNASRPNGIEQNETA